MPESPAMDQDELVSVGEVARYLGVSTDTVRRWARTGRISCIVLPSGHRRFRRADLLHITTPAEDRAEQAYERRTA